MLKLFLILLLLLSFKVFAHQPKLIKYSPSKDNPHVVMDPEISKAYYGNLKGDPHYYKIESNKEFLFYTSILSPKVSENYIALSIDVMDEKNNLLYQADGTDFDWTAWYEPYARDWYWMGPQIGTDTGELFRTSFQVDAGMYLIKVYNDNNKGHLNHT